MKKIKGSNFLSLILGGILLSGIVVYADSLLNANDVLYAPNNGDFNVSTVKEGLDELYNIANGTPGPCTKNHVVYEIGYTGKEETFTAGCNGLYKLEVWGAQGQNINELIGGYGAYAIGYINLNKTDNLYINVGETPTTTSGGYNGGGTSSGGTTIGSGGGATHIALVSGLLKDLSSYKGVLTENAYYVSDKIIIVAGGGGGASYAGGGWLTIGGAAGGLIGNKGKLSSGTYYTEGSGGTQTAGGAGGNGGGSGSFGQGGNPGNLVSWQEIHFI